jgi:hypothetical protein
MDQFERLFTPEEANQLLDSLRPLVDQLVEARDQVSELRPDLAGALQKAMNNGGSLATGRLMGLLQRIRSLVDRIQAQGVLVKDIDQGLLDFPARVQGRIVFLCWKHGEGEIAFWHDLESGFASRQPL